MLLAEITPQQMLLAAGAFGVVISVWLLVVLAVSMRKSEREMRVARRLGELDGGDDKVKILRLWHEGEEATTFVPSESPLHRWWDRFRKFPDDAGWNTPVQSVLLGIVGASVLAFALTYSFTGAILPSLGVVAALILLFSIYTRYLIGRNMARFEKQFAAALQLLARSLRAGHPLTGAFRLTAEEMQPPVSHIFARICQEQSLGVSVEKSLRDAAGETNSADVKLFATSVAIQIKTGGNLADMMDRLAEVIRSRIRLSQRVRIVSAQTQLSKRILLALPLLMLLLLSILNPAHMDPLLETSLGKKMLLAGGVAMLLGWYTMNRMVRIKY